MKPRALKGFKTVKMVQERRLIFGTALLQLHKVVPLSLIYSSLYISYAGISQACFFLSPSAPLPPHLSHRCQLDSSPPSILIPKHLFLHLLFSSSSFTVISLSSARPSLCTAPFFGLQGKGGGKRPRGMLFMFRGRRGRGRIVSEGEGTRSVKGIKGRMGGERKVRLLRVALAVGAWM